jgi:hypothetical protein
LKELKVEQTVNGKAFYKTYVKGEEFNHVQRDKSMSLWVSMIQNIIMWNRLAELLKMQQLKMMSLMFLINKRSKLRPGRGRENRELEHPNADELLYCTMLCEPLDGFIQMHHGRATFFDARNQIARVIESFLLPKNVVCYSKLRCC